MRVIFIKWKINFLLKNKKKNCVINAQGQISVAQNPSKNIMNINILFLKTYKKKFDKKLDEFLQALTVCNYDKFLKTLLFLLFSKKINIQSMKMLNKKDVQVKIINTVESITNKQKGWRGQVARS